MSATSSTTPAGQGDDVHVAKPAAQPAASSHPSRRRRALPAWLNHFNRNDLKVTLRCWVAVWIAVLLIFINPSLQSIGLSTFFAAVVLFIVPPAGILMVYLLASLSLLLGMCLAWAWGLLTMKAAFAVRSESEMQSLRQSLQQQVAVVVNQTGQPPALVTSELVFDGFFLDAPVVAIYYVMCCVFIYALARVRYANAKLVLLQIFGTIVIDVFLVTGPVLTQFNAKLARVLVEPAVIGVALGVACSVLIFPQSTSYVLLSQMEQLIRLLEAPLESTRRLLSAESLSDDADADADADADMRASKAAIVGTLKAMGPSLAFLPLDSSSGRWNADDVKSLYGRVRDAVAAGLFLLDFHIARTAATAQMERLSMSMVVTKTVKSTTTSPQNATTPTHQHGQDHHDGDEKGRDFTSNVVDAMKSPEQSRIRPGLLEALQATTAEVLQVSSLAIKLAAEAVHVVNSTRWYQSVSSKTRLQRLQPELKEMQARLQTARHACVANSNDAVVEAHADLFDEQGLLTASSSNPLALNGLVVSMVLEERIANAAATTEKVVDYIAQLLELRTQQRIWLPTRLRYAFSWLTSRDIAAPVPGGPTDAAVDPDDVETQMEAEAEAEAEAETETQTQTQVQTQTQTQTLIKTQMEDTHQRLRMVRKGNRGVRAPKKKGRLTRAVVGTYRWLFNPGGIYALRMVIVTIALSIPSSLPSTAGFFYREKGIWAVIMAQTCLLMYMADFTFSLASRGLGTVIGGVLGMVAWYAGSGSGVGNPFGMGATTAVIAVMLMWWRLYLPAALAQASIMTASTFMLIVGYSWDQYHLVQYGQPGVGYQTFWKRLVMVLIGFAAAFIVQIFPKPPSATRHVSKSLANHVRSLNDHYALLISQWSHCGRNDQQHQQQHQQHQNAGAAVAAEKIALKLAEDLDSLTDPIRLLRVEISTTPFDQAILLSTRNKCHTMNQSLGKLLVLSASLPNHLQHRLGQNVGLVAPRSVSNVMSVLSIVESSLRTGDPLPERLPVPLVESCFVEWFQHHERAELSVELVRSEAYRQYCVAVSSYLSFLATVDDLVGELKGTLGETHVVHQWEV
ncbi:hypothetical protein E4U43_000926 [Claviceps pusilla]|uniref:ER transporter 6TM N-terminal domain-containing protein n=1 Tax=Claviceps pusilla TaxID=123648 RepID=A0A9P7SXA1_9HYPO|nr:hypothetical protein E4U43_000926 [Claviceps pusilla]